MALIELNDEEQRRVADIVDGTISSLIDNVDWDNTDVKLFLGILDKLGERGREYAAAWNDVRNEEQT